MKDFTTTNLEAAILDQVVGGTFGCKAYAYTTVVGDDGWQLAIAVANEQGYNPLNKSFKTKAEAETWVNGLNAHIGVSENVADLIVVSTMRGRRFAEQGA